MNNMFLDGLISLEMLEEVLYNPRTHSNLEEIDCPPEALDLFEQGMVFNDIKDLSLVTKSISRVTKECSNLIIHSLQQTG